MSYNPETLRSFFDDYGEREWNRYEDTLPGRLKCRIHKHILAKYLTDDLNALDVGCGPGRFALDIAGAGARVTLADISSTQLQLAKSRLSQAGLANTS